MAGPPSDPLAPIAPPRRCPRCAVALVEVQVEGASPLACAKCGGVFLGNLDSQNLVEGHLGGTAIAVGDAVDRYAAAAPPTDAAALACPLCAKGMVRVITDRVRHGIDGVSLDVCVAHGTWFDAHELRAVAEAADRKRRGDDADADALRPNRWFEIVGELVRRPDWAYQGDPLWHFWR